MNDLQARVGRLAAILLAVSATVVPPHAAISRGLDRPANTVDVADRG